MRLLLDAGADKNAKNKVRGLVQNDHDCVCVGCVPCANDFCVLIFRVICFICMLFASVDGLWSRQT